MCIPSPEQSARPEDDALASFIQNLDEDDLGDLEDPTDEQILNHIRAGLADAKAGRGRPAREALAELRNEE